MKRVALDIGGVAVLLGSMILPAIAVAGLAHLAGASAWRWYHWVALSPAVYVSWLFVFLVLSAAICYGMGRRHPKPAYSVLRRTTRGLSDIDRGLVTAVACYRRSEIVARLPLVSLVSQIGLLRDLVLRAYSPSVHLGRRVLNMGHLSDPDLTEIGDDVVIGGDAIILAHALTAREDGVVVYVSAPVTIGARTTIGGSAHVALGVSIGEDAVVELGAVVPPFTRIPAGEVWGGNPAVFRRSRRDPEPAPATSAIPPPQLLPAVTPPVPAPPVAAASVAALSDEESRPGDDDLRQLVIAALNLNPRDAAGELSRETCAAWDSLGQVAIAAAVFDRFGVTVEAPDVFRIRSLQDIADIVGRHSPAPGGAADEEPPRPAADAPATGSAVEEASPLPADIEMLPLMDPAAATRALMRHIASAPAAGRPLRMTIAASFTAEPLAPTLRLWARAFGLDVDCRFAPYDQIVQTLMATRTAAPSAGGHVVVVLTRPEDLESVQPGHERSRLDDLIETCGHFVSQSAGGSPLLVGTLPPVVSAFSLLDAREVEELRHEWRRRLEGLAGVELFDFAGVVEHVGSREARSSASEVLSRAPYSPRLYQELAIALVRQIRAAYGTPAKVLALDCDNTIWGGVLGEVGPEGIALGDDGPGRSFTLFQRYLKRLQHRGLLLVVVSRNEDAEVREIFERHPDMVLRPADIAAWRVGWGAKSESLRDLADELGLGLDSFVLLDDDPAVRLEVETRAPDVHVVPLPPDPAAYCETLSRLWLFDGARGTSVDAARTLMVQAEARRREEQRATGSVEAFLERLELWIEIAVPGTHDWARIAQLTQRTNQFNLSLKRRTVAELRALGAGVTVLMLRAGDRFGEYGTIGACILTPTDRHDTLEMDTLLISCRALGRGVEHAFLYGIAMAVAERGAAALLAPFVEGPRNAPVKLFLSEAGFTEARPSLWSRSIHDLPQVPRHVRIRRSPIVDRHTSSPLVASSGERHPSVGAGV